METGEAQTGPTTGERQPWVELEHGFGWNDLVLGRREREQLRTIAAKVRMHSEATRAGGVRRGMTALFVGGSGTGKTMAAQILGADLDRPVLEVDLVDALSTDEGDAADVLDRVFEAAGREHAIVVFDGVRSLVGRRARGRIDTAELLGRASKHDGLVIFTWRPTGSIDLWLPEQVDFLVELPFPAARARSEIWRRELPADALLSDGDIRHLARSFRLTGGAIRRCCRRAIDAAAASGVPVGLEHLAPAIEREYEGSPLPEHTRLAIAQLRTTGPSLEDDAELPHREAPTEGGAKLAFVRADGQQRAEPESTAASSGAGIGRGWVVLGVLAAAVAAAAGFVIARGNGESPRRAAPDRVASTSAVRVSYPSSWRRQTAPAGVVRGLSDGLAIGPNRPQHGVLVIGRARRVEPSLLPSELRSELASVPTPEVVTLGSTRFLRYRGAVPRGGSGTETVYATPTTAGTIVAVCAPLGAGAGFMGSCERVLATAQVLSGKPLPPGPSATYGSALDRVIARLGQVRSSEGARLRAAHDPGAVAQAAAALAAAHRSAASAVLKLDAGQAAGANAALGKALQQTAGAYTALADAVAHRSQTAYRAAGGSLARAQAAVAAAYAELGRLGYSVG
jgi:hypothetical protein